MEDTILVALDGSARVEAVFSHAAQMAPATGRELLLLRVVPSPRTLEQSIWPPIRPIPTPDQLEEEIGRARASRRRSAHGRREAHLRVETAVREGDPAEGILATTQEIPGSAHTALTTHDRNAVGRWVFGSVAAKVLHGARVPLLVVPTRSAATRPPDGLYHRILVPLDGAACAEQALGQAAGWRAPGAGSCCLGGSRHRWKRSHAPGSYRSRC